MRVTSTAIRGSDLHVYNGIIPQGMPLVLGHKLMGIVDEAGNDASTLRPEGRVTVPFAIACRGGFFGERDLPGYCERPNPERSNPGRYGRKGTSSAQRAVGSSDIPTFMGYIMAARLGTPAYSSRTWVRARSMPM
ncbi:alcohol dehydrogenase catalytic domain-containing protein [Sorangium sp. So ce1335]|uniref:alcohol dehydrogenase catalytic domain-containing protein n=1 Tax=Sorangium sp. So ce1335 TaxID=3133335 RepID=UPI003F618907